MLACNQDHIQVMCDAEHINTLTFAKKATAPPLIKIQDTNEKFLNKIFINSRAVNLINAAPERLKTKFHAVDSLSPVCARCENFIVRAPGQKSI